MLQMGHTVRQPPGRAYRRRNRITTGMLDDYSGLGGCHSRILDQWTATQAAPKAPQRKRPCRSRGLSVDPCCSFALNCASSPRRRPALWAETLGGPYVSIEAVLLIVILTFGFGSVLNRWDMRLSRLRRRRAGRPGAFF